jgi:G-patch protein
MATVTHYIRSETDDAVDPWQSESLSAGFHTSQRLANAPKFVPALLSYDEWGNASNAESTLTPSHPPHGDVASWYRSLSRQGPKPTRPQSQSHVPSHNAATCQATPEPSSSSPSITASAPSSSIHATGTLPSSSSSTRVASRRRRHREGHEWFISRAISQSQSASTPPSPRPSSSLADMLSRYGPSTEPIRPPIFLHLGPSNKGWAMLQNQGWSEGEGLGAGSNNNDAHTRKETLQTKKEKGKKRTRLDSQSPPAPKLPASPSLSPSPPRERATKGEQEEEILIDDDDDDPIVEVRKKAHVRIIDLTQSDTEDEEEGDGYEDEDLNSPAPPTSSATHTAAGSDDPRAAQTALLTPLPTVLKSDRLGIGLKAKTEGPYHSSVKRVTHNAAALAAHLKAADDRRRTQRLLGKGRRAFARTDRLEREHRQKMMAYFSEP